MWIEAKIALSCVVYVGVCLCVFGVEGYFDNGEQRKLSEGPLFIRFLSVTGLVALLALPICVLAAIWLRA